MVDVVDQLCLSNADGLATERSSFGLKMLEKQLKVVHLEREDIGDVPYRRIKDCVGTEVILDIIN